MGFDFTFILLVFSAFFITWLLLSIIRKKRKTQLHYMFLIDLGLLLFWCTVIIIQVCIREWTDSSGMLADYFVLMSVSIIPVTILLTGKVFARTSINFSPRYLLLFVVPAISILLIWTNDLHQLFYVKYSVINSEAVFGRYFPVHAIYSYACIIVGLFYLFYYTFRNSGLFSRQALLLLSGFLFPFMVNVLFTFNIIELTNTATPITFTFLVVCCMFATLKYEFLNLVPIALRIVTDSISDSFIVLNNDLIVVDYNRTLINAFDGMLNIEKGIGIAELLCSNSFLGINNAEFINSIRDVITKRSLKAFDKHICGEKFNKHFTIEITPIIVHQKCAGTIILLKDITQIKKGLECFYENQTQLRMERHEFINQINTLAAICALKRPDTLERMENYLMKLIKNPVTINRSYNTGNCFVDGLLATKNSASVQKHINFDVSLDFPLSEVDVGDIELISIIGNIIDNAFDALTIADGGKFQKKVVSVYSYQEAEKCCISISNNGPRIPESDMDKIFENKFTTKSVNKGERGFGLFITKELVEKNNGTISVRSSDEGTEFLLKFHMKQTHSMLTLSETKKDYTQCV